MKEKIFIGSSKESLCVAEKVKNELESYLDCECIIWSETFFTLNLSTYENLATKAHGFDFAIFIGGEDSIVYERRCFKKAVRDNVLFELGLYAGIISYARTFFVLNKNCKLLSDLKGITINYYSDDKDIKKICEEIHNKIKDEQKISRITSRSTVPLALSYYNNFLAKIQTWAEQRDYLELENGCYRVDALQLDIRVVLPGEDLCEMNSLQTCYYGGLKLKEFVVSYSSNRRGINIRVDEEELKKGKLIIYDIPTILDIDFNAIEMLERKDYLGDIERVKLLKKRSVRDFEKTIRNLTENNKWMTERLSFIYV